MKKYLKYLKYIPPALILVVITFLLGRCPSDQKAVYYKGQYEAERALRMIAEGQAAARIDAQERVVAELMGALDSAYTVISGLDEKITMLREANTALGETSARLRAEVQPVIDANPKLREFIFSLDAEIANRDGIIFALAQKVLAQEEVINIQQGIIAAKTQIIGDKDIIIDHEKSLRLLAEKRLKLADQRVGQHKFLSKASVVLLGIAGGIIVYQSVTR